MRLRYVSPLNLPRVEPAHLLAAPHPSVAVESPGTARQFVRHAPEFIDDPAGTGLFAVFGAATYTSPPAFLLTVPNPLIVGYRTVVWDGAFCNDEAGTDTGDTARMLSNLAQTDAFLNEDTGLRPAGPSGEFVLDHQGRPMRDLPVAAVVLCSHEPSNYGSFLFRVLPKLHAVRGAGLGHLPMQVWAYNPAFLELLDLAGVPRRQIIDHETLAATRLQRAIVPSLRNPHAYLDDESRAVMQGLARRGAGPGQSRHLYVSRMGQSARGSGRRMMNEAEVAAAMAGLGFTILEPERLSPAEQIAAFANADVVVGPAGSALFNTVFCRPGTVVVDIESEPNWIYAHAGLFASCGLRYGIFVGAVDPDDPTPVHRRFSVDVPALTARVAGLLDGRRAGAAPASADADLGRLQAALDRTFDFAGLQALETEIAATEQRHAPAPQWAVMRGEAIRRRLEWEAASTYLLRRAGEFPDALDLLYDAALAAIDAGTYARGQDIMRDLGGKLAALSPRQLRGVWRAAPLVALHDVAMRAFQEAQACAAGRDSPSVEARLQTAWRNSMDPLTQRVAVVSIGETSLPWHIGNRWGLRPAATMMAQESPFNLAQTTTDDVAALLRDGLERLVEPSLLTVGVAADGTSRPLNDTYHFDFNHERGELFLADGFAALRVRYGTRIGNLRRYLAGEPCVFVHYTERDGDLRGLAEALGAAARPDRMHLVILDAWDGARRIERLPAWASYHRLRLPWPGYHWFQPDHWDAEAGVAFERELQAIILQAMGTVASRTQEEHGR